jgi:hypothetical protein
MLYTFFYKLMLINFFIMEDTNIPKDAEKIPSDSGNPNNNHKKDQKDSNQKPQDNIDTQNNHDNLHPILKKSPPYILKKTLSISDCLDDEFEIFKKNLLDDMEKAKEKTLEVHTLKKNKTKQSEEVSKYFLELLENIFDNSSLIDEVNKKKLLKNKELFKSYYTDNDKTKIFKPFQKTIKKYGYKKISENKDSFLEHILIKLFPYTLQSHDAFLFIIYASFLNETEAEDFCQIVDIYKSKFPFSFQEESDGSFTNYSEWASFLQIIYLFKFLKKRKFFSWKFLNILLGYCKEFLSNDNNIVKDTKRSHQYRNKVEDINVVSIMSYSDRHLYIAILMIQHSWMLNGSLYSLQHSYESFYENMTNFFKHSGDYKIKKYILIDILNTIYSSLYLYSAVIHHYIIKDKSFIKKKKTGILTKKDHYNNMVRMFDQHTEKIIKLFLNKKDDKEYEFFLKDIINPILVVYKDNIKNLFLIK